MRRNGFRPFWSSAEHGFTLVEMLIALTIFGMLTAAGVALLTVTARTQETSDRLLAELGEIRAVQALLTADLAQAAPRIRRDANGRAMPAFAGGSGQDSALMTLVRRGWEGGDPEASSLQRVDYRLRDGQLERLSFDQVDGSDRFVAAALLDGVRQLRLRYRDREGGWHSAWRPTDGTELPVAVELVTDSESHGMVRQLFLVGAAL
jgi:general secretion pathway protein J